MKKSIDKEQSTEHTVYFHGVKKVKKSIDKEQSIEHAVFFQGVKKNEKSIDKEQSIEHAVFFQGVKKNEKKLKKVCESLDKTASLHYYIYIGGESVGIACGLRQE